VSRAASPAGERGFALLIVLWTLVLASLIGTQVTAAGRGEVQLAANLRAAAVLEAAADGVVHEAIFRMLDRSEAGWRADGRRRVVALPNGVPAGAASVLLEDQAGKLNPNTASQELLAALLRLLGADARRADGVAAAIADWRFPSAAARPLGGKAREYRAAGLGYGPPEAPFRSLGEVGAVLGMTPALLARLAPHFSLFQDGDVDPGLAGPLILQALRSSLGAQEFAASTQTGVRVVAVTASVARPDGANFTRRAVVRVGAGTAGRPYQILAWDGPGDEPGG